MRTVKKGAFRWVLRAGTAVVCASVGVAVMAGVASASSLPAIPALPQMPQMQVPALPALPSMPALPSLPSASMVGPTGSPGGSVQAWGSWFSSQYAAQSSSLNSAYSGAGAAVSFAKSWAQIVAVGNTHLTTPSLGSFGSLPNEQLPAMSLNGPSTPGAPSISSAALDQVFGAAGGSMLPPPPGYATIAVNPIYTSAAVQAAMASHLQAMGCVSGNACLVAVALHGLASADQTLYGTNAPWGAGAQQLQSLKAEGAGLSNAAKSQTVSTDKMINTAQRAHAAGHPFIAPGQSTFYKLGGAPAAAGAKALGWLGHWIGSAGRLVPSWAHIHL